MRLMLFALLCLMVVSCFGQKNNLSPLPGAQFEVTAPVIASKDFDEAIEYAKSVKADDKPGIEEMLTEKRIFKLEPGMTIIVLQSYSMTGIYSSAMAHECRVVGKDGKSLGKYPIYAGQFRAERMKQTKQGR